MLNVCKLGHLTYLVQLETWFFGAKYPLASCFSIKGNKKNSVNIGRKSNHVSIPLFAAEPDFVSSATLEF